jgi:NADH-quinone oxidoreductase subunit G
MAKVYIDDREFEVDADQSLLQAALSLGFNLPYFCWHPALGSVGACRQCAVKQFRNEQDLKGKLVMACMTPASEGTRISIEDAEAGAFRAAVIEGLMLSHPHDCPVCDEGGQCHLQDMTVMTGHDYRRYGFGKRTHRNQYLGPFLNHEMNRCIQCYRCVRFYREYAGGRDLNAFSIRNTVYFGRHEDGVLENEFSGNLDEVCPTGVFTDATLGRHYVRKWDLRFAPSLCFHCGVGCNTSPAERYGMLRRIGNRYNGEVNGYFLCDRGRFGYEFVNHPQRVRKPLLRAGGADTPITGPDALRKLASMLTQARTVIGIGSPRASLESNFMLRAMVGPDNFFSGVPERELRLLVQILGILRESPVRTPSIREIEESDAVLVLGEDLSNVAPRVALALRQSVRRQPMQIAEKLHIPLWLDHAVREAVQGATGPLFVACMAGSRLDDIATHVYRDVPDNLARLGFAVAHKLDPSAPAVSGLPDSAASVAAKIAGALIGAKQPLIISGISSGSEGVIHAAANVALALHRGGRRSRLSYVVPDCNSLGIAMMGPRPLEDALELARSGNSPTTIILENDLYRRAPARRIDEFFDAIADLAVLDSLENRTTARAGLVIPAGTFAESDGTLVSFEGRAQRYFQVFVPETEILESWRWLRDALVEAGRLDGNSSSNLDEVLQALAEELPQLALAREAAPPSTFRMAGGKVPRAPHRLSGRTAMVADVTMHEPPPPPDPDSPLSFSMEGTPDQPPSPLVPFFWAPGWNSIQSLNKFQEEIAGPLRGGDPGIRLIEPGAGVPNYLESVPGPHRPDGDWLIVPLHHIFGSEELSALAPAIAERSPKPYAALNASSARSLGIQGGEEVEIRLAGEVYRLPVRVVDDLGPDMVGIPAGLGLLGGTVLPARGRIARV